MADFNFTEQRRRNGRLTYERIIRWHFPALDFPGEQHAQLWNQAIDYFEGEMNSISDLEVVVVDGKKMRGFAYTYYMADWIYSYALQLGATVASQVPTMENVTPFVMETPTATAATTARPVTVSAPQTPQGSDQSFREIGQKLERLTG